MAGIGGTGLGDIALVPAPFLKHPKGIRDVTEWYCSTRSRRTYIHAIFEKQVEYALANLAAAHDAVGDAIDVVYVCGTDFGTQTSSFCSVPTFRELYFPYYQRMNTWIHAHTGWKTFKHSCGRSGSSSRISRRLDSTCSTRCSAPPPVWSRAA